VRLLAAFILSGLVVSTSALRGGTATPSRAVVKVAFSKTLKRAIVVDAKGRTLYMFTTDTNGLPNCAKVDPGCPKIWPAFMSAGKPLARAGINSSLLGIVRGARGSRQVAYNRHPLYYYLNDAKPGEVNGQACFGLWYVLAPKGVPIRKRGPQC
jgi:predicted lipoprotein with Yx(FWY)xxD motif